jgi:hypothetical protein
MRTKAESSFRNVLNRKKSIIVRTLNTVRWNCPPPPPLFLPMGSKHHTLLSPLSRPPGMGMPYVLTSGRHNCSILSNRVISKAARSIYFRSNLCRLCKYITIHTCFLVYLTTFSQLHMLCGVEWENDLNWKYCGRKRS